MKIAILTTDNREPFRQYDRPIPWFGTAPEALLQGFAHLPEAEVHVISCTQQPMTSPLKLAPNIWFHSLHVPKLGWTRTLFQGCVRAVRKKLRAIQPDVVHGQGTERDCALSAVFSGFPNVLTIHGNMRLVAGIEKAMYWKLAAGLETFTVPRSNGVICISDYTRRAVEGLAKKTWLVPNAVDEGFFEIKNQPTQPPVILCVGGIVVRKNPNAFIRALDPLAAKKQFRLIFAGDYTQGSSYGREFLGLIKTRAWCKHVGFIGREEFKKHLAHATLVALPSLEDNCPMAVLEGAAAGVPVAAANVGGVPDLIKNGINGLLFDPHDAEQMRMATEKLLTQADFARALAAEANCRAKERFYPTVIARRHLEIYREVPDTRLNKQG